MSATADNFDSLANFFSSYLSHTLQSLIPAPLFQLLARFSNLSWRLVAGSSNDPSSWTSTLLPPLIALFAAYLSLLMAYRTLRSTVLLVLWGIKWGAIIGVGIAIWAWWTGNQGAASSVGEVPIRGAGLVSWIGGLAGGNGAMVATALPLLSSLYGAAAQDRTNQAPQSSRQGPSNAAYQRSARRRRGQSAFSPLDEEGELTGGRADAETLLRSAIDTAGSLFGPAGPKLNGRGDAGRQRTKNTAQKLADLLGSANSASRQAGPRAAARGASLDQEDGQDDVLSSLLSNVGLGKLVDVAQGVSEEGDQSQMSRWMEMLRDTLTEETRGAPASASRRRTSRSSRRGGWLGSRGGSPDSDEKSDDGDDEFVLEEEEDDEEDGADHSGDWPWSSTSQRTRRGPAANTRSSRREAAGRR